MKAIAKNGKFLGMADDKQLAKLGLNGGKPRKGFELFDSEKAAKAQAKSKKAAADAAAKKVAAEAAKKTGAEPAQVKKAPASGKD